MNSLSKVLEGILDADFDIRDNDVMPGVRNWPRFISRLQHINKPKVVSGSKRSKWMWQTEDVLKALSQGIKSDIGSTVGKNVAWDASIDREQIVIATFQPRGDLWAHEICIGNNDGYIAIKSSRPGFDGPTIVTAEEMGNLGLRLETITASNWKLRLAPLQCYDIIKRELELV